ncbi:MAG: VTC domain-containing protein [Gemmataceae bacterium]
MTALPALDLRSNLGTWSVPAALAPGLAHVMTESLPLEAFDAGFRGQDLETTYFDTNDFDLRKARNRGNKYLTLRIRCYQPSGAYALSAKTDDAKYRLSLDPPTAEFLLDGNMNVGLAALLSGDLLARLADLTQDKPLVPVTTICFRRYAVENERDRFTFDTGIHTQAGKRLWTSVLEFKSTDRDSGPPPALHALKLTPIKLSKFLWATRL